MIKKIGLGLLSFLVLTLAVTFLFYLNFRSEQFDTLVSGSKIANTSAGSIEYKLVGDTGPVVLFLHGTPGGYDQAEEIAGLRTLAPSRPGYLRTPLSVGSTPVEQAHAYAALLDALNIKSVVVLGVSGGGPSSISFAALYPERTLALIALEAVSQTMPVDEAPEMPIFMQSDFLMWVILSMVENFMGSEAIVELLVPDAINQELILGNAEKITRIESLIWSAWPVSKRDAGMTNDFAQFSMLDLASKDVTVPALIIHGTKDTNVPFSQSVKLADQVPDSVLHEIEGGDHMMPFSHSEEVAMAIEQFLNHQNIN